MTGVDGITPLVGQSEATTRELLNAQTGRLSWAELARSFARGAVIVVQPGQDLISVAESLVNDSSGDIEQLHQQNKLHRADDHDAVRWQEKQSGFWAVVVAPWVLVQEISDLDETEID